MIREGINKMKLIKKQNNKKGFTLIELVIVIAILAILALILIPAMSGYISSADSSKYQADARSVYTAASVVVAETDDADKINANTVKKSNIDTSKAKIDVKHDEGVVKYIQYTPIKNGKDGKAIYFDGKNFTETAPSTTKE